MRRTRTSRPLTVLLVEDDGGVRRVIRDMLRQGGYAVREAADGAGALDALAGDLPDVVLLDVVLPELNGLQVLEWFSASGIAAAVPVVAITGSIMPDETIRAHGACAVLRKPFAAHELRRALERALEKVAPGVPVRRTSVSHVACPSAFAPSRPSVI